MEVPPIGWSGAKQARSPCSAPMSLKRSGPSFRDGVPVVLTSASLAVAATTPAVLAQNLPPNAGAGFSVRLSPAVRITLAQDGRRDRRTVNRSPRWILEAIRLRAEDGRWCSCTSTAAMERQRAPPGKVFSFWCGIQPGTRRCWRFARDVTSVLFGLDSFWYGVDVAGEALEHVIITQLPFPVPGHEARLRGHRLKRFWSICFRSGSEAPSGGRTTDPLCQRRSPFWIHENPQETYHSLPHRSRCGPRKRCLGPPFEQRGTAKWLRLR